MRKVLLSTFIWIAAVMLLFVSAAQASLTYSGDIYPANPNTWTSTNRVYIGYNTGDGTLTVDGGSVLDTYWGYLGYSTGHNGSVTVSGDGSKWTSNYGSLFVGRYATGLLSIVNGGLVGFGLTAGESCIGYYADSIGMVTVDGTGSKWTNKALYVGRSGSGTVKVTNGGSVSSTMTMLGRDATGIGTAVVDGTGSAWSAGGSLSVGNSATTGTGRLSISDGAAATASDVSINSLSFLTNDVGKGSSLTIGGGTGALTNNGTIRLVAGAGTANGTYTPISAGTWAGAGTYQALGGVWNSTAHTVTVSSAATGTAGAPITIDLSTTQRVLVNDPITGKSVGASFLATTSPTNLTLTASAISGSELTSLQSLLDPGKAVLSGWDFTAESYTAGDPVYLSLFAGPGQSLYSLDIWHFDGSAWSKYAAWNLAYDNTYASFTVNGFSGYAVSGTTPVPIPPAFLLFGSGLVGMGLIRRRSRSA